jgi:hypothetical protein
VADLITLVKLIVFHAIQAILQPTITQGNVRNAIVLVLDGLMQRLTMQGLRIANHVIQLMRLRTIIQANARVVTLLLVGQELSLTIAD